MEYNVLLAEDQKKLRDVVRDYFAAHGVSCDLARDGTEALDLLRDHDYDAVLLDVMMPNLDGFSVCKAVRQGSNVPIIFLTALSGEQDTLRGYELGADDYVTKPFSLAVRGAHPPQPGRIGRAGTALRRHHPGAGDKNGDSEQYAGENRPQRVRPAAVPDAPSGTGAEPKSAAGQGVGHRL